MVSSPMSSKEEFVNRFMNLEKTPAPERWMKKTGFKGKYITNLNEITALENYIMCPNKVGDWWAVCDKIKEFGNNFKIYPILNREFWVVEVQDERRNE